jgi:hypothetical protein
MIYQQKGKYKNILQGEDDLWRIIPRQSQDTDDTDIELEEVELGNIVPGAPPPSEQDQEEPSSGDGREVLSYGSRRSIRFAHQSARCGSILLFLGAILFAIICLNWLL